MMLKSILRALSKWSQTHREWKRIWLKQPKCGFQSDCSGNYPCTSWDGSEGKLRSALADCNIWFGFYSSLEEKSNVLPRNYVTLISAAFIEFGEWEHQSSLESCPSPSGPAWAPPLGTRTRRSQVSISLGKWGNPKGLWKMHLPEAIK